MAATVTSRRTRIAVGASAVLLGGSFLGASAAQAVSPDASPARPWGRITAVSGLNVRQYPSTDSSVRGVLRHNQRVGLDCKVRAQNINGNTWWYKLRGSREAWVTGRYLRVHGSVNLCKNQYRSSLNGTEQSQKAQG